MYGRQRQLEECFALLERGIDLETCLLRYPELADEIEHFDRSRRLLSAAVPSPDGDAMHEARSQLMSAVATPARKHRRSLFRPVRLAAIAATGGLLLTAALGASAAGVGSNGPTNQVLTVLGLSHGEVVQEIITEAFTDLDPSLENGRAVSLEACLSLKQNLDLPPAAQDALDDACARLGAAFDAWEDIEFNSLFQSALPGSDRAQLVRAQACERIRDVLPAGVAEPRICDSIGQLTLIPDKEVATQELEIEITTPAGLGTEANLNEQLDRVQQEIDTALDRMRGAQDEACQRVLQSVPAGVSLPGLCEAGAELDMTAGFDVEKLVDQIMEELRKSLAGLENLGPGFSPNQVPGFSPNQVPGFSGNNANETVCNMLESMGSGATMPRMCSNGNGAP